MALPILDGNQSATTLSTIVTGGQHIPAHTVVSLGSQAITDMRSAVSGSVVSISNFPSAQTIAGTVTANVAGQYFDFTSGDTAQLVNPVYYDGEIYRVTPSFPLPVTIRPAPYGQTVVTISGTVTANVPFASTTATFPSQLVALGFQDVNTGNIVPVNNDAEAGLPAFVRNISVEANPSAVFPNWLDGNTPIDVPISGTVTANNTNLNRLVQNGEFTDTFGVPIIYARVAGGALDYWQEVSQISGLPVKNQLTTGGDIVPFSVSGSVTASISGTVPVSISSVTVGNSVTIGSLPTLAPQLPRVTFIDGSGSVTTANSAITVFATSTTRSYLLVQVTTGSAFVNVGATATTVNGINLTAGQGYAWETTIPQGLVSLISTTTSSRWVAKEA